MATSGLVKNDAKEALKNNWLCAVITGCILTFLVLICILAAELLMTILGVFVSQIIILLFGFFVITPLFLGVLKLFWGIFNKVEQNPVNVFYYFSSYEKYLKSIKVFLYMFLKVLPLGIVFHIPAIAVWLISQNFTFELLDMATPLWASNLQYIGNFLFFAAALATFIFSFRYYMAPMLIVVDDNMVPLEAINMSSVISKRSSLEFVSLLFSLFGWIVLGLLIMPLPVILPYLIMCYIVHVCFVINEYNEYVALSMQNEFPTFTVGAFYDE